MTAEESVSLTGISVILFSLYLLAYWLFVIRPMNARTLIEKESENTDDIQIDKRQLSDPYIRGASAIMAFIIAVIALLVGRLGYLWFFGITSYGFILAAIMCFTGKGFVPTHLQTKMKLYALAHIPFAIALGLAWASFCGWYDLTIYRFQILCAVSEFVFIYILANKSSQNTE